MTPPDRSAGSRVRRFLGGELHRTVLDASAALGAKGAGMILGLALQVLAAQWLGASEVGAFFYGMGLVTFLVVAVGFGVPQTLLRDVAASDDERQRAIYLRTALALVVLITVGLAGIAALAFRFFDVTRLGAAARPSVVVMAVTAVPAVLCIYVCGEWLRGALRIGLSQVLRFTSIQITFLLLWMVLWPDRAGRAMALYALAAWVVAPVVAGVALHRSRTAALGDWSLRHELMAFVRRARPFYAMSLANIVIKTGPLLVVGWGCLAEEFAFYHVSNRLASFLGLIILASNSGAAPRIGRLYAEGRGDRIRAYVQSLAAMMTAVALLPFLAVLAFPELPLRLFGAEFADNGASVLRILLVGQMANICAGPIAFVLLMTNHARDVSVVRTVTAVLCVVTLFLVVKPWGIVAAASVQAATIIASNAALVLLVRYRNGFWGLPNPLYLLRSGSDDA